MSDLRRVADAVPLGRVEHQIKLFAGFLQFIDKPHRVLHIHIIARRRSELVTIFRLARLYPF